ncbi:hypothetical protein [Leptospira alstonii]|uniref:Uncharacterized protein n=1 Tax=Leptospira alstonii serovar Sichuan str. 79601 TaxID=1218565 RepID=M6DA18_9LEPT|nr:hypothetical protein [Leptospira alstonii]AGS80544.1 hypothetical protein LEP1GSC193_0770 [Leptospira phage vB_LalZ_80412-LE1]EMJ95390.1 hypothetical protein LEP1GSC194_3570 [Leptospira alstonii serovar Sichuan str. 79601]
MKKFLSKIINIFWPFLEGEVSNYNNFLKIENMKSKLIDEKDIDRCIKMYEFQRDRIKTIESKSIVFIGFFGSIVALLGITLKEIILNKDKDLLEYGLMLLVSIFIIYTSTVIRYAIKALERKAYYSIDEKDIFESRNIDKAIAIINKIKRNYDAINTKVDSMTLAQEFAKRILYLLIFLALMSGTYSIMNLLEPLNLFYICFAHYLS